MNGRIGMGLTSKLTTQILNTRRRRSSDNLSNLPFEISIESMSESDKFVRRRDKDQVDRFNKEVVDWSKKTTQKLRISVKALMDQDLLLSKSIKPRVYYDRQYAKEANRIGFSFEREGIYMHKGAGRGQGGFKGGSSWYNNKGERKQTLTSSLMKMGSNNRQAKEWFDPIVEREVPQLADIVSDCSVSLVINATNLYID